MKLQASLRSLYEDQLPLAEKMRSEVDRTLRAAKNERWHYESRVKRLESFCSKIETGRVENPRALDDFLACTLVVPNALAIPLAVSVVEEQFEIVNRKPESSSETLKPADTFRFDDLRMYCRRYNDGSRPSDILDDFVFEVQIKTFLQHAWAIATHDLSYKASEVRWGRDRIVAHLKAAIEHAEVSILEADVLSQSNILQLSHPRTENVIGMLEILKEHWQEDERPYNLRGLAETLADLIHYAGLEPADIGRVLAEEREAHDGTLPANLSPYGVIIRLLILKHPGNVKTALRRKKIKILLTPELEIPPGFPPDNLASQVIRVP